MKKMDWNKYINTLEKTYRIKIDSRLRNTIINYFIEDLNLYTEQDMYEQSRKLVLSSYYSKINGNKNYKY